MTHLAEQNARTPREIQVLTFTVMGVRIGVDAEQVSEMMDVQSAEARGLPLSRFHERVPYGDRVGDYLAPKVIVIKDKEGPFALVIDRADDIIAVNVDSIQPLPPLIARTGPARSFWGAVEMQGELVFLLDFKKLA